MHSLRLYKWRFTKDMIADAPEHAGVYVLWDGDRIMCVGHADGRKTTIRSCLLDLFRQHASGQSLQATHYGWEICADPATREDQVLRELQGSANVEKLDDYRRSA